MRKFIAVDNLLAALKSLSAFIEKSSRMYGGRYLPVSRMSGGRYFPVSRMTGGRYFPVLEDMSSSSENIYMVS